MEAMGDSIEIATASAQSAAEFLHQRVVTATIDEPAPAHVGAFLATTWARGKRRGSCPLVRVRAHRSGLTTPGAGPSSARFSEVKALHVVGAALIAEGRCLVARRRDGAEADRWEFPGGKVERGEEPRSALRRELREELGVESEVGRWLGRGRAPSGEMLVVLDVYEARLIAGTPAASEHSAIAWLDAGGLEKLAWCEADVPVLPAVIAALKGCPE
jgi:8-oxo-dGTP diphosphatase